MNSENFTCSITANITAKEAFESITKVNEWWTENLEGHSQKLNDVFTAHFGKTFTTHKLIEVVPGKKIVWLITDCHLDWLNDKKEWKDTKMSFEITSKDNATQINFTHIGLTPEIECYNDCRKGWTFYITESLFKLITEHKGTPEKMAVAQQ